MSPAASQTKPAIECLGFSLALELAYLLRSITFTLEAGQSLAVLGPVGSGKSMLLNTLSHLVWGTLHEIGPVHASGVCRILGHGLTSGPVTPQQAWELQHSVVHIDENSAWMPISIEDNFALSQKLAGVAEPRPYLDLLTDLPLSGRQRMRLTAVADLMPMQIEPPILQLLAIIRGLLRKPRVILLDDPFLRMDPVLVKQTEHLIEALAGDASLVLATNDLHQASRMADWILLLDDGCVVEYTEALQFFTHPQTRLAENFVSGRDLDG